MTLPLMPACAGRRSGLRGAGAALLVLLTLGGAGSLAQAEDAGTYAATVTVDATADTVVKARETARTDGQRRALAALVQRLAGGTTPVKLPKLDDQAITDMVLNFQVANEHMSAVRYLADYTFNFRPEAVRRVMANASITAAAPPGGPTQPGAPPPGAPPPGAAGAAAKSIVVVPVYQADTRTALWDDPNPWRDAWDSQSPPSGPVRLLVPLGDAGDMAAVDAAKARGGDAKALAAVAEHNGGDVAAVAVAAMRGPADAPTGVDVTVRDYRAGQLLASHADTLAANPGETGDALLRRAAAAIAADIEGGWKKAQAAKYDQQGSLTAVLPIDSLDDWVRARTRIASLPAIRSVDLVALSRQEATIELGYIGSIDDLKAALAQISLDLVHGDPLWRLAHSGSDRPQ